MQWKTFCHGFIGTLWLFLSSLFVQKFVNPKTFPNLKEDGNNLVAGVALKQQLQFVTTTLRSAAAPSRSSKVSDEHGGSIVASASVQHKQERDHRKSR